MAWQFIVAIIVAIPIILIPVALIWYLNVSGIAQVIKDVRRRKALREKREEARVAAYR